MRQIGFGLASVILVAAFCASGSPAVIAQQPARSAALLVGAARVDITPPAPEGNKIRDRLYTSAIVNRIVVIFIP